MKLMQPPSNYLKYIQYLIFLFLHINLFAVNYSWNVNANGEWTNPLNWNPNSSFPNAGDDTITFGTIITAPREITVGSDISSFRITFTSPHTYTLTGNKITLTTNTSGGRFSLSGSSGDQIINNPIDFAGGSIILSLSSGSTLFLNGDITSTREDRNGILLLNSSGTAEFGANTFNRYRGIQVGQGPPGILTTAVVKNSSHFGADSSSSATQGVSVGTGRLVAKVDDPSVTENIVLANPKKLILFTDQVSYIEVPSSPDGYFFEISAPIETSGSGSTLAKTGNGILKFSNPTNTYTSATNINAGTLWITGTGSLGTSPVTIDGGTLRVEGSILPSNTFTLGASNGTIEAYLDSTAATLSGPISGAGNLTKSGAGSITLSGSNTYTGTTTVSEGALQVDSDLSASTAVTVDNGAAFLFGDKSGAFNNFSIANSGTVTFTSDANNASYAGTLSGTGACTKTGNGTFALSGANTYSGGTTITGGTLSIDDEARLGDVTGGVTLNGGVLETTSTLNTTRTFTIGASGGGINVSSGTYTIESNIQGSGAFEKLGAETLVLGEANDLSGAVTISAGTLTLNPVIGQALANAPSIANSGTLAISKDQTVNNLSGTGAVSLGSSALTINSSSDTAISGIISGSGGSLVKTGTGTLTLLGTNTYTGGNTISAGVLKGTSASVKGAVANNAILNFDQSSDGTFAGVITGSGSIIKTGGGILTVSGDSNVFAGTTAVNAGTLSVTGTLYGDTIVGANGILKGNGTLENLTNNGVFEPGSSIGTITIMGDFVQGANGSISIEIDPTDSDLIQITAGGTATLDGTLEVIALPGVYMADTSYTFLTAEGGVIGTFATFIEENGLGGNLTYLSNSVVLNILEATVVTPSITRFLTGNAKRVSDYLFCGASPTGDLITVDAALVALPNTEYAYALTRLCPAQFKTLNLALVKANSQVMENAIHLVDNTVIKFSKHARGIYLEPFISVDRQGNRDAQPGYVARNYGVIGGVEWEFSDKYFVGGSFGYNYTDFGWKQNAGYADMNSFYLGPSFAYTLKEFSIGTTVMAVFHNYDTTRKIQFTGINRQAKASHNGGGISTRVDAQYCLDISYGKTRNLYLYPRVAGEYVSYWEQSYRESGAQSINLQVGSTRSSYWSPSANLTLLRVFNPNERIRISPSVTVGYHGIIIAQDLSLTAKFVNQNLCKPNFTTKGCYSTINQAVIGGQILVDNTERFYFSIGGNCGFGYTTTVFDAQARAEWKF